MHCCTDLRLRILRHGPAHGRANSRGPRLTSTCTSTHATRRTTRSKIFCVAHGGERPMKRRKRNRVRRTPMRIERIGPAVIAALLLVTSGLPAFAHHAFGSEFDSNRPVLLKGKVVRVEWVNPHAWIHMEVTNADGTKEVWMIEGGSPNSLLRRGVTKESLKVGTEIVVDGYQSRDYTLKRANGRNVTYPDGRQLNLGSSNPDADKDEKEKPADPPK